MGKHFGELFKLRGIVYYSLSPFEQRAFAGVIKKGLPNMVRRIREEIFYVVPPLLFAYIAMDQAEKYHAQLLRKDPKDYENDQ